ncbi:MAG: hypothetical protein AAGC60_25875 [Acidobacteriota bacterium]
MHLRRSLLSRLLPFCAALFLVATAAAAGPAQTKEAAVPEGVTQLEVNWDATQNLVFIELPSEGLAPAEAQVRIAHRDEPLFFEGLRFAPAAVQLSGAATERRALQLMAYQPEERAELLDALRKTPADEARAYRIAVVVDGQPLIDGSLIDIVRASDTLRQDAFMPLESTSDFADLRPALPTKLCRDDCYDDYADCRQEFCYWEYNQYMCDTGCREWRDECLAIADPTCTPPPPPTCTPGVVRTETDTVLTNSQFAGLECLQSFWNEGTLHTLYYLTYQTTTTEIRRRADCTTYSVVTGVSYSNTYCYNNSFAPCGFAFLYPFCIF